MQHEIWITVNGIQERIPARASLHSLIDHFKEFDKDLIVELNGRFVHAENYAATIVQEGDILEFINPHFGG